MIELAIIVVWISVVLASALSFKSPRAIENWVEAIVHGPVHSEWVQAPASKNLSRKAPQLLIFGTPAMRSVAIIWVSILWYSFSILCLVLLIKLLVSAL